MFKEKKCIVTVINSISETSMPFNEFILYRYNVLPYDRQFVIVCSESIPAGIKIPEGLSVFCVGNNRKKILNIMRRVEKECNDEGMKLIVHLHQPKSAMLFNLSTLFKNYRKRTVFTIHSLFEAYNIINKFFSIITSLLVGKVTCVSEASYNQYPDFIKRIKKNNIMVLKNGVDLRRIDRVLKPSGNNKGNVKTLIYVARMIPIKNHKFLLKVFSKLNDCKLVLIGTEDKSGEIRKLIKDENLSNRVEIAGLISRDEVFRRLKQADIYVSTSLVEGMPVSVLEAMYVGLPVVISNIQPHLEIGIHSKSVVTIPLDENEWIETLNRHLELSDDSLKQVGIACKNCAQDYFSLDKMLKSYDELYETL